MSVNEKIEIRFSGQVCLN